MEKVEVPAKPGRLINAIANIGYDPEVAICDLVDNSIDAHASNVQVVLEKEIHEAEGLSDSIGSYIIADDGSGMNRDTLIDAFTLGTERDYPQGSLGKFGLGLKSAGLSLGREIIIMTLCAGASSPIYARLSISDIEESGEYKIELGEIPSADREYWEKYGSASGTVLMIRSLNDGAPAHAAFSAYLQRYCSTVYHRFIESNDRPLRIQLDAKVLDPFDPLFFSMAKANGSLGDPANWDGRTVSLLLDGGNLPLSDSDNSMAKVSATHLIHPPTFGDKQQEMGQQYGIVVDPYTRRPRHGFYVYRNERIISLAERFHGLVGSQVPNWAFKARLEFDQTADSLLSLDVKKRHCLLPKKARQNLKAMVSNIQAKSTEAWRAAGKRQEKERRITKDDIANDSIAKAPVTSLSYAPGSGPMNDEAITKLKEKQKRLQEESIRSIQDDSVQKDTLDKRAQTGDVVTKVRGIKGNAMWLPYAAVDAGKAETIVNENHSWVSEAYAGSESEPGIAIILHQFFTILSRAELDVRSADWPDIKGDHVGKVLDRFKRRVSTIGEDLAEHLEEALSKDSMDEE